MRSVLLGVVMGFVVAGCGSKGSDEDLPASSQLTPDQGNLQQPAGVTPMTPTPTPMTPMSGTQNLQGGGGGINQAAKSQAKSAAAEAGNRPPSESEIDRAAEDTGD